MYQHLLNCSKLWKGHYSCLACGKRERIAKFHCKRCPSRTAKSAKKFFSMLGSKSRQHDTQALSSHCDNYHLGSQYGVGIEDLSSPMTDESPSKWGFSPDAELPLPGKLSAQNFSNNQESSSSLCQINEPSALEKDSNPVYEIQSCEVPIELSNTEIRTGPAYFSSSDNEVQPHEDWYDVDFSLANDQMQPRQTLPEDFRRSLAPLDTYNAHVPDSRNRATMDKYGPVPMSFFPTNTYTWSQDNNGLNHLPVENVSMSSSQITSQSAFTKGATASNNSLSWNSSMSSMDIDQGPNSTSNRHWNSYAGLPGTKESTGDAVFSTHLSESPTEMAPTDFPCAIGNDEVMRPIPNNQPRSPIWTNEFRLVASFKGALDEQLCHSKSNMRAMHQAPIIRDLLDLSTKAIVSIGLDAVSAILNGRPGKDIQFYFAFAHVAYAFAMTTTGSELEAKNTKTLFESALSLAYTLNSKNDQSIYRQIVSAIWEPPNHQRVSVAERRSKIRNSLALGDNQLVVACKNFLDGTSHSIEI